MTTDVSTGAVHASERHPALMALTLERWLGRRQSSKSAAKIVKSVTRWRLRRCPKSATENDVLPDVVFSATDANELVPVLLPVFMERPPDNHSPAESSHRGAFSLVSLSLLSGHTCAVSWHAPWFESAVESLKEMGGRGDFAPALPSGATVAVHS